MLSWIFQEFDQKRLRSKRGSSSAEEDEPPMETGSKKSDIELELLAKTSSIREPKNESVNRRFPQSSRTQVIKRRREKSTIILVSVVLVRDKNRSAFISEHITMRDMFYSYLL